jgi:hypothetical protein
MNLDYSSTINQVVLYLGNDLKENAKKGKYTRQDGITTYVALKTMEQLLTSQLKDVTHKKVLMTFKKLNNLSKRIEQNEKISNGKIDFVCHSLKLIAKKIHCKASTETIDLEKNSIDVFQEIQTKIDRYEQVSHPSKKGFAIAVSIKEMMKEHFPPAEKATQAFENWYKKHLEMKFPGAKYFVSRFNKHRDYYRLYQELALLYASKEVNKIPSEVPFNATDAVLDLNDAKMKLDSAWNYFQGSKPDGVYSFYLYDDNNLVLVSRDGQGQYNHWKFYFSDEATVCVVDQENVKDYQLDFQTFKKIIGISAFKNVTDL